MTRKHFEFIASTIASMPVHSPSLRTAKRSCALSFADALAKENPRFDRVRFLKACGEEA